MERYGMQLGSPAGLILRGCVSIRTWVGEEKGIAEEVQSLIDNLYAFDLEEETCSDSGGPSRGE